MTRLAGASRLTALAWLATVSTSVALFPLFQSKGYLIAGAAVAGLVGLVGLGLRALRVPVALVVLAQVATVVVWVVATRSAGKALYGILPTPEALQAVMRQLRNGVAVANDYAPPVPRSPGLVLLVALGIAAIAILVDLIAIGLNRVAWAGIPLLALYAVPAATVPNGVPALAFIPGAFGFIALLSAEEGERVSHWGKRITRAGRLWDDGGKDRVYTNALAQSGRRIGTTAIALAVVIPLLLPAFSERLWSSGTGGGDGSGSISIDNPIVDLRRDLVQPSDAPLIFVETKHPDPSYLRLAALDAFDGFSWRPSVRQIPSGQQANAGLPPPPGLSSSVETSRMLYTFDVSELVDSTWLPEYYPSVAATARGDWRYDEANLDILSADADLSAAGQHYELRALEVRPTSAQLQNATAAPPALVRHFTELPSELPAIVAQQGAFVVGNAETDFERAIALQDWFRSTGDFTYSTKRVAGNSTEALTDFLTRGRTGYCEQFAAAMAVLARTMDIPARVAVGFLHPDKVGKNRFVFSSHDLHTWPELYFQGVGWVRFEPTPAARSGSVPPYTSGASVNTLPDPDSILPDSNDRAPDVPDNPRGNLADAPSGNVGAATESSSSGLRWGGWALLSLAVLLVPAVSRLGVRAWRWRRAGSVGNSQAEAAWAELRDSARDLGLAWGGSLTPRGTARGLAPRLTGRSEAAAALSRLVAFVERSRYARDPGDTPNARSDVKAVVAALSAGASRRARLRAHAAPASLLTNLSAGWLARRARSGNGHPGTTAGPDFVGGV